jgi:hypothetical protein
MSLDELKRVADVVLYEGYVLYPYRASSRKNRYRWTFGVVAPRAWSAASGGDPSSVRLECLIEADGQTPVVDGRLRFLQVERRTVEAAQPGGGFAVVDALTVGGNDHVTWEEGCERELPIIVDRACEASPLFDVTIDGGRGEEALRDGEALVGRVVRTRRPLAVSATASLKPVADRLFKLTIAVENATAFDAPDAPREEAVPSALVGAHLVLSVRGGAFVSLLDPPPHAAEAAAACVNAGLFPVLGGKEGTRTLLLASPIVLYDHPAIAAESPGDTCDGTEIDELLALSTRSLTDAEKREARATDRRAAEIIDRADRLSADELLGLHGRTSGGAAPAITRGSRVRVRLAPATGSRRTDAQDMFLDGRIGVVEEVREDVDGQTHLAIILEDDPAADLHRWYGRHLHFRPDEVELVEAAP